MTYRNIQKQFKTRANTYNESANWITDENLIRAIVDAAGNPASKGIDLCCGTGIIGKALSKAGWKMTGIDITREMLSEAKKNFPVICHTVEDMPFRDKTFDLAVMRQAFFLLDAKKTLYEIHRVLRDCGIFVFSQTVPFSNEDSDWLRKIHLTKQAQMIKFYSTSDLEKELQNAGFLIMLKTTLPVRESITRWMEYAPELNPEKKAEICDLVRKAPPSYKKVRNVLDNDDDLSEDWNWVIFKAVKQ